MSDQLPPTPHAPPHAPPLAQHPCRSACAWGPTERRRAGLPLFRCASCASEWVRSEPWTPAQANGTVAPSVAAEAARR